MLSMFKKNKEWLLYVFLLASCFIPSASFAAAPTTINFQGYLQEAGGRGGSLIPVTGNRSIVFKLYTVESGGTAIWTSTKTVTVNNGVYSVVLGDTVPLTSLNFDEPYYLGINVANDGEMTPRQPLTAAAYAIQAKKTEKIGTLTANKWCSSDGTIITCTQDAPSSSIADNAVTTSKLANNAVTTAKITDANVTTDKLANNTITTAKITDGNVTTSKLADDAVTTNKLANNAVTTAKITDANVTTDKLANNTITTAKITDGNVTTSKLADDAVTTSKIKNADVTEDKLAAALTFDATDLLNLSGIDSSTSTEGLILPQNAGAPTSGTAEGQMTWDSTNDKLYVGNGTNAQEIGAGSGGASNLSDLGDIGSATTTSGNILIADGTDSFDSKTMSGDATITSSGALSIANNAITTAKITDANVTMDKLADNAVTTDKIATGTITNDDVNASAAIATSKLSGAVTRIASHGLGTIATQAANSINITGGSISGITDLAVADGGTGASDAATARTNLGAQASDTDLTQIAGLDCAANEVIKRNAGDTAWECAADASGGTPTLSYGNKTETGFTAVATCPSGTAIGGGCEAAETVSVEVTCPSTGTTSCTTGAATAWYCAGSNNNTIKAFVICM